MKSFGIVLVLVATVSVSDLCRAQCNTCRPVPARRQCPECTASQLMASAYHMNNAWPKYYVPPARCAVNSAISVVVANGWRRQNLLGDYHFQPNSHELTTAGQLKAQWIMTQAPQERRRIFVERGKSQDVTDARIAAVQNWAAGLSPAVTPAVQDTHIVSEGHPASTVDTIFVGFQDNLPAPVLPPESGSGASSSAE